MADRLQFTVTVDNTKTKVASGPWQADEAAQVIADAIRGAFWNIDVEFNKRIVVTRPRVK